MQIYDILMKDHEEVKQLLSDLIALPDDDEEQRMELVEEIRDALIPHARAEERVFYNALREMDTEKKLVWHGYSEHMAAEGLLRTLQVKDKANLDWKSTAIKLRDALESHIAEEESRIFAEARKVFTAEEAEMIGTAFERLKTEVQDDGFMKNSIDMVANLMPPRFSKALGFDDKGATSLKS